MGVIISADKSITVNLCIREHWILNQATRRLVGVKIGDGLAVSLNDDTLPGFLDFFEEGREMRLGFVDIKFRTLC